MSHADDFFYAGGGRREAVDAMFEGLHRADVVLLIVGSAGAGRSAIIKRFVDEVDPGALFVVVLGGDIFMGPHQAFIELVRLLGGENASEPRIEATEMISIIRNEGRDVALMVDDAHELSVETRAALIEFAREHAVGLVLVGDETLAPMMDPSVPFEVIALRALTEEETEEFVAGWLGVGDEDELPSHRIIARLHRHSAGLPGRLAGLLGAGEAARSPLLPNRIPFWHLLLAGAASVLLLFLLAHAWQSQQTEINASAVELPVALPAPVVPAVVDGVAPTAVVRPAVIAAVPQPVAAKVYEPKVGAKTVTPITPPPQPKPVFDVPGGRLSASPTHPTPKVGGKTKLSAGEQAILGEPESRYTLQLFASFNEDAVAHFRDSHPELGVRIFRTAREELPWYVAVSGSYRNRDDARAAVGQLPRDVQAMQPWARSLRGIQDELRRRND